VSVVPQSSNTEYVSFILRGFVGIYYQLESSEDLINWTDEVEVIGQSLPAIPITQQSPFPFTIFQFPKKANRFYRIYEVPPPASNQE
jgi:hypothetical protein